MKKMLNPQTKPQVSLELFLTESKSLLSRLHSDKTCKTIRVVMGNKTCDLDSTVCALAQGLLEYVETRQCEPTVAVIPVMNITKKEFRLKTEVVLWLEIHKIPQSLLTFRDHINLQDIQKSKKQKLELILVDHHTLQDEDINLKSSVVKIIDHRPHDISWPWPKISLNIETVGSCATLVARNILQQNSSMMDNKLASFLRGPILVDTFNMSNVARHKTAIDIDILASLERLGGLTEDRDKIFSELIRLKTDISKLTLEDLLIKDLKVINDIPIMAFPIEVARFLSFQNAQETIERFSSDRNYPVIILIGSCVLDDCVSRDIAIFYTLSNSLGTYMLRALISSRGPDLNLEFISTYEGKEHVIYLYNQRNLEVTRKRILPLVQQIKLSYDANKNK